MSANIRSIDIAVAIIVSILCFADWLLGEKARANMRYNVGYLYLYINDVSINTLVIRSMRSSLGVITRMFDDKIFGIRFIVGSLILSASGIVLMVIFIIAALPNSAVHNINNTYGATLWIGTKIFIFLTANLTGFITDWLAMAINITVLRMSAQSTSTSRSLFYFYVNCGLGSAICLISFLIFMTYAHSWSSTLPFMIPDNSYSFGGNLDGDSKYFSDLSGMLKTFTIVILVFIIFGPISLLTVLYFIVNFIYNNGAISLLVAWISCANIFVSCTSSAILVVFFVLRLTSPIIQPALERICYAFYDSRQGVLSTIALFIGGAYGIVKYFA